MPIIFPNLFFSHHYKFYFKLLDLNIRKFLFNLLKLIIINYNFNPTIDCFTISKILLIVFKMCLCFDQILKILE